MNATFEPEPFDEWFRRLPLDDELMKLIYQVWQVDQLGKMNKETLLVKLMVEKNKKQLDSKIVNKFSEVLSLGLIDNVLRLRD